jgi:anti-sigma factor RsiW
VDDTRTCPPEETLHSYAEGLLGEDERSAIEAHLGSCGRCRGLVGSLEHAHRTLAEAGAGRRGAGSLEPPGRSATPEAGCPDPELLAAYADGSIEGRRAAAVEDHLVRCGSCLTEVADLLAMSAAPGRDAPDRAVERALGRLDREGKTAVVRLAERSVALIRDFARTAAPGATVAPFEAPAPAFATARRGRAPARLHWSGGRDLHVECEIMWAGEGPALTGRITAGHAPARAASVTLRGPAATRGPESIDARGRFGPWPLPAGTSTLVLSGVCDDGALELTIEVEEAAGGPDGGAP